MERKNRGLVVMVPGFSWKGIPFQVGDEFDPMELKLHSAKYMQLIRCRKIKFGDIERTWEQRLEALAVQKESGRLRRASGGPIPQSDAIFVGETASETIHAVESDPGPTDEEIHLANKEEDAPEAPKEETPADKYELDSKGGGWYDVLLNGKAVNDKSLRERPAKKLLKELRDGKAL